MNGRVIPETANRQDWPRLVAQGHKDHESRISALEYKVTSVAASYTETTTSGEIVVKVTASGKTVTLPTAVGNTAKMTFKLMVAGSLTIDAAGSETIDGGLTATLSSQYTALTIVSDGARWLTI